MIREKTLPSDRRAVALGYVDSARHAGGLAITAKYELELGSASEWDPNVGAASDSSSAFRPARGEGAKEAIHTRRDII